MSDRDTLGHVSTLDREALTSGLLAHYERDNRSDNRLDNRPDNRLDYERDNLGDFACSESKAELQRRGNETLNSFLANSAELQHNYDNALEAGMGPSLSAYSMETVGNTQAQLC